LFVTTTAFVYTAARETRKIDQMKIQTKLKLPTDSLASISIDNISNNSVRTSAKQTKFKYNQLLNITSRASLMGYRLVAYAVTD